MMLLALLLVTEASVGCHSSGPTVSCRLPPPIAIPPASTSSPAPRRAVEHNSRPKRRRPTNTVHRELPVDPAAHVRSLVSIGDCTGARTYLLSAGEETLAAQTFSRCIGAPAIPPAR